MIPPFEPPFPVGSQLCAELDYGPALPLPGHEVESPYLPGYPLVSLHDRRGMLEFLEEEYCSADLDRMAGKLWWMSKQDSANISPLHRQFVKQRRIVATEDPKLHLVWIHDRIFVKPLPRYLASWAFWRDQLGTEADDMTRARSQRVRAAALGFLRTYVHLVKSEYDFCIAQDPALRLIPAGITWGQFCRFTSHLATVSDRDVSGRYAYGEIRLTRLNFYAPFLLGKANFQRVEYQSSAYFAHFYGPILFLIGMMSIVLNGLQIAVGVEQAKPMWKGEMLLGVALWFSIAMILCFCCVGCFLLSLFLYKVAKEWTYATRDRLRLLEEGRSGFAK
jgi:hypothetical protein